MQLKETIFEANFLNLDKIVLQKNILQTAFSQKKAVAFWRLPKENQQHLIVDLSEKTEKIKLDIEESRTGFAVSPFLNSDLKQTYFIGADLYFTFAKEDERAEDKNIFTKKYEEKRMFFDEFQKNIFTNFHLQAHLSSKKVMDVQANHYKNIVTEAVNQIKAKQFQKVVLSRTQIHPYPVNFDLVNTFQRLCNIYPNAFCYFYHIPTVGTWMGASPETLISVDKNQIFRTVALAGTQANKPEKTLQEITWSQKEIEEQAMVSRYIINCFKKIRLREFEEEGPKTVIAGNLLHLKTCFEVDMQATNFPQLGTVMLDLLHPTSAVCGMPKMESLQFILENENYQREFYSGFLGPINLEEESHLFVNLRCLQFLHDQIIFYAGAGITEDSDAEKEWIETEMKCKTMAKVIFNED